MYLFSAFSWDDNDKKGVLYKVVDPIDKDKILVDTDILIKVVKYYPNPRAVKSEMDPSSIYFPKRIGNTNVFKMRLISMDTLIDVDSLSLAKLYVEVNKEELFQDGNIKRPEDK